MESPLGLHRLIPPLTARRAAGGVVHAWDFKQKKNLVLIFLHAECPRCEDFLRKLKASAAAIAERNAVALVVFPNLPAPSSGEPFPGTIVLAADLSGRAQRAFLGDSRFAAASHERLGVFVTDRFGELFAQWTPAAEDGLPDIPSILAKLDQIEIVCEECSGPPGTG